MDLLEAQAEIKARYHPRPEPPREAGKFVTPETAGRIEEARALRKQDLKAELIARGLLRAAPPPGCTMVKQHVRHVGERVVPVPTLFDAVAA